MIHITFNTIKKKVLRQCATERRHKEVVHQLLRVEEVSGL